MRCPIMDFRRFESVEDGMKKCVGLLSGRRRTILILVASLAVGASRAAGTDSPVSQMQSADQPAAVDSGWAVNCQAPSAGAALVCQMSQTVSDEKTGQSLIGVVIRPGATAGSDKPAFSALLALPHGLFVPAGVRYRIDDGQTVRVEVQTSDPRGAYAAFPLDAATLEALKRGRILMVTTVTVKQKTRHTPVSLEGFTAAIAKIGDR